MKSNVLLVDIDGTIYNANSTFDFLDYYFIKSFKYRVFRKSSKSIIGRVINKISIVLFHYDLIRALGVKYLKGYNLNELRMMTKKFYTDCLYPKRYDQILQTIKNEKKIGHRIVLASATLDFISEFIATEIEADDYISTELCYKNNICVGKIKSDRLGHKEYALANIGISFPVYKTITDNVTDYWLLQNSESSIVIVYPSEKNKWKQLISKYKFVNQDILPYETLL